MTGLEAINAANGWAMSLAGITIVLTGLAVLSTIISQLHKVVGWMEKSKEAPAEEKKAVSDTQRALAIPEHMPDDIDAVAGIYKSLTDGLTPPFEISRLFTVVAEHNLPHVHLSVRALRDAGHLIPDGEGRFSWKP